MLWLYDNGFHFSCFQTGINVGTSQGFNFDNNPAFSKTNDGFTVNNGFSANPTFNNDGFNNPAFPKTNNGFTVNNGFSANPTFNNDGFNNPAFPKTDKGFTVNNRFSANPTFNNDGFNNPAFNSAGFSSNSAFPSQNNPLVNPETNSKNNAFPNNNNIFGNNNNALGSTNSLTGRPSLANRLGINSYQLGGFQTGEVVGSLGYQNGAIVIAAEVRGGNPPPAVFVWRIQLPNGTFVDVPAGEGGSTAPVSIAYMFGQLTRKIFILKL